MALTLKNSATMTAAEMAEYWPDIIECLEKYCGRFHSEETVSNIVKECAEGRRQLWLVLDETGRVILTPITEIVTLNATGKKQLLLAEVGGKRLRECMPLLRQIEEWAKREHGAEESQLVGRASGLRAVFSAWGRHLMPLGYKPVSVIYRKEL